MRLAAAIGTAAEVFRWTTLQCHYVRTEIRGKEH